MVPVVWFCTIELMSLCKICLICFAFTSHALSTVRSCGCDAASWSGRKGVPFPSSLAKVPIFPAHLGLFHSDCRDLHIYLLLFSTILSSLRSGTTVYDSLHLQYLGQYLTARTQPVWWIVHTLLRAGLVKNKFGALVKGYQSSLGF